MVSGLLCCLALMSLLLVVHLFDIRGGEDQRSEGSGVGIVAVGYVISFDVLCTGLQFLLKHV